MSLSHQDFPGLPVSREDCKLGRQLQKPDEAGGTEEACASRSSTRFRNVVGRMVMRMNGGFSAGQIAGKTKVKADKDERRQDSLP